MTKTDIAVADAKAANVGEALPDFLKGQVVDDGSDNFDDSDVVLPKIKLLQGTSEECTIYDNARPGIFWHTGLDVPLGESFEFVIGDRRKKYLLSAPIEDGQGVLARADDAKTWDRTGEWSVKFKGKKQPITWTIDNLDVAESGLTNWGTQDPSDEDSPPAATLFYDYLIFLPNNLEYGPAVMSLARSQIKQAKKGLNDKIKMNKTQGRPMQALVFGAKAIDDSADGQDFKNWKFLSAGYVQDEGLYNMAREHAGALANVKIQDEGDTGQPTDPVDDGEGDF